VRIDATLRGVPLGDVPAWSRRCEEIGFGGLFATETNNDPFLPVALAAEHTRQVEVGTGIAIAFARSPMQVAYTAWDLQALARGRFVLGLGTQVRAHVERRFGATWSRPAERMREYVAALDAIWSAWLNGTRLNFRGDFYEHTLMPPAFHGTPHPYGPPPVFLAGVRERMIETAGEAADGLLVHPFHTERYLRDVLVPALERGLARGQRRRGAVQVSLSLFVAITPQETEEIRRRIAFYASTPAYRKVLDALGWGDLFTELHELSRTGGWERMPQLVTDEVLDAVAVRGASADEVAEKALTRYGALVDRINLHAGEHADPRRWAAVVEAFGRRVRTSPPAGTPDAPPTWASA
jgi:probable F420-dependent oxidoreductase